MTITREEAVKRIQRALEVPNRMGLALIDEESAMMAIEALQARTDGDTISRQDALKPFCVAPDGTRIPEVDCDNFPVEFSVEFIKKHLLSLPSVETIHIETFRELYDKYVELKHAFAEAKWVPCSESLPSDYGEYLATVDGETIEVSYVPETKGLVEGWSTCNAHGYKRLSGDEVIAWRPKPKSYKGE